MDTAQLREFYKLAFPNDSSCWAYLACDPSSPASGYVSVVRCHPETLANRAEKARSLGKSIHMMVAAAKTPGASQPSYARTNLEEHSRHFIVADIDTKEQTLDETGVVAAFKRLRHPPTYILTSSNGYHLYWMCDKNLVDARTVMALGLYRHVLEPLGLVVDRQAGYRMTGLIRAPGSTGKCGTQAIGENHKKLAGVYEREALAAVAGYASFNDAIAEQEGRDERATAAAASSWTRTTLTSDRDMLMQECAAYREFVEASARSFDNGASGNRSDVQMFGNLTSRSVDPSLAFDPDDWGQHEAKRAYFHEIVGKWPGYDSDWNEELYRFGSSTAPFHCDKWGQMKKHCAGCPVHNAGTNPIAHANNAVQYLPDPTVPNAAPVQVTPASYMAMTVPTSRARKLDSCPTFESVAAMFLSSVSTEYVANEETLFRVKETKAKKGPGMDTQYIPICSPPIFLVEDVICRPVRVDDGDMCERALFARWDTTIGIAKVFTVFGEDLKNPNRMSEALIHPKVTVINAKELADYYRRVASSIEKDAALCYEQLGWQNPDCFVTPYAEVRPTDMVLRPMSKSIENQLIDRSKPITMTPGGTGQEWVENVLLPVVGMGLKGRAAFILIMASFGSVLYSALDSVSTGPMLCLYGKTGRGKTLAMKLAMSVWYHPNCKMSTARDTPAGIRISLGNMNHLPLFLDEMTHMDPEKAHDLAYEVTNRSTRNATQNFGRQIRDGNTWCNSVISTSNESLSDLIGGLRSRVDPAALSRVVDIPQINDVDRKVKKILDEALVSARQYHGSVGLEFVQVVMNNLVAVKTRVDEILAEYENIEANLTVTDLGGSARFRLQHLAVTRASSEVLDRMFPGHNIADKFKAQMTGFSSELREQAREAVTNHTTDFAALLHAMSLNAIPGEKTEAEAWFNALEDRTPVPTPDTQVFRKDGYLYVTRTVLSSYVKTQVDKMGRHFTLAGEMKQLEALTRAFGPAHNLPTYEHRAITHRMPVIKNASKINALSTVEFDMKPLRYYCFDMRWLPHL